MAFIFNLLYLVLILGLAWGALCIVFHITHYSIFRSRAAFGILLFGAVALVLFFTNALLFFSLPLADLLPKTFSAL